MSQEGLVKEVERGACRESRRGVALQRRWLVEIVGMSVMQCYARTSWWGASEYSPVRFACSEVEGDSEFRSILQRTRSMTSALYDLVDDQQWQVAMNHLQGLSDSDAVDKIFHQGPNTRTPIMLACRY